MKKESTIYLDHAATTPVSDRVFRAMRPYFRGEFGNPSSLHTPGRRARHAVEEARNRVADILRVKASEVLFTGSGTESDNTAILAVSQHPNIRGFLISGTEHKACLEPVKYLLSKGYSVSFIPVDASGSIQMGALEEMFDEAPLMVSAMHVNNETGVQNPIEQISDLVRKNDGILHTDAIQSPGCHLLHPLIEHVDYLSLSAHKIHGPKGVGMLYVRDGSGCHRLIRGGAQERGRRSGTENVAGIVGLAEALDAAQSQALATGNHLRKVNRSMRRILSEDLGKRVSFTAPEDMASPHILHALFFDHDGKGLDGEMLILGLDMEGVYVSSGSACTSGAMEPSHVLEAIGLAASRARGAVRFSFSSETTVEEAVRAAGRCVRVVDRLGKGEPG